MTLNFTSFPIRMCGMEDDTIRIQWSEVVENFVSVRKMNKTSGMSSLCVPCIQSMTGNVHESESKNVSTPGVNGVSRKRVRMSREERESHGRDNEKRARLKKEEEWYLTMNTKNLDEMKAHLEALKLRLKEMKEKKKLKKK